MLPVKVDRRFHFVVSVSMALSWRAQFEVPSVVCVCAGFGLAS